jgi:hypothetical protein
MAYKQFCAFRKPIFIVNHTNGLIRLNHWVRASTGSAHLLTDNIAYGENKLVRQRVSDAWTITEEDYTPFFWMRRSMAKNADIKNLMIYQIREPFSIHLISSKNIELHIYNENDPWYSENTSAKCEHILISFSNQEKSEYMYI